MNTIQKVSTVTELVFRISEKKFFSIAGFLKVIGALDGTFVRIVSPGGEDAERFRCRKNYFALNVQTIVDSDLVIRNVVARWPDPEPPADPQIEALVRQLELENEDATLSFETRSRCPASFAKRNVIVTNFFSN
ncbi:nuclease HARBI1 [Trichonephila clavipes]|nr:nuclease HARBI1 [Trichonephila clavipes]